MAIVGVSMSFDLAKVPRLIPLHYSSFSLNSAGPKRIRQARCVGSSGRTATVSVNPRFGSSKGGAGLLERPSFDQSQFEPMTQVRKVAKILSRAVPLVTPVKARKLFHESRKNKSAIVIVTMKEHAEFYAQTMLRNGLLSAIQPVP
ncbi:hypothetical protein L6164_001044 [Bauhinia variegata]|uniref:Uncharacterized protein n=1 Tax=Bauhinia variegata TaxID=167791 RepID=A0ACB9Q7U5_BAUVA|nr:hypothetical protein L6164_001044 [Bauhinia variegata]